jgi:hypothetical protein
MVEGFVGYASAHRLFISSEKKITGALKALFEWTIDMAESDTPIIEEPTGPYPRRYWWLKRLTVGGVIALLLLTVAWFWWRHDAETRLDAALAQLRAAGDPVSPDDLTVPDLKDADNAAYWLKFGASKINPNIDSPSSSNYEWNSEVFPYPPKWFSIENATVGLDQAAFKDLREARRHSRVQWLNKYPSPLATVLLPHLNSQRNLANHASDYAMLLHFNGNDAEALEMIEDIYAQSDAGEHEPFLVSHLVSLGIRALATDRLSKIAPELTVKGISAPTTHPNAHPATREQVQRMIARLLETKLRTEWTPRAYTAERLMQLDTIQASGKQTLLLEPMLKLDATHTALTSNRLAVGAKETNWPAAEKAMKALGPPRTSDNPARVIGQATTPSLDRAMETTFRVEEECKATAVSLAFRLDRLDHGGAFPSSLQDLVPNYLPGVPIDPFAPGNRPLGYVIVENGKRPIVYSVGDDGIDDTAAGAAVPKMAYYGWSYGVKDQYQDLTRWHPPASAIPKLEDDSEVAP